MAHVFDLVAKGRVRVSRAGVALFSARWPGSKLSGGPYWFEFDRSGLTDTNVPDDMDGPEVLALADDAEEWMVFRRLPEWAA